MSKQVFEYTSKPGDVFEFGGKWYISEECNYINQYQAEEGFDIFVTRSGNYTTAHEISAESQEVQAHLAQKEAESKAWHDANDHKIALQSAKDAAKRDEKQAEARMQMETAFPIGCRVQNRNMKNLVGTVVAYHPTEPKISIQWDGKDQPATAFGNITQWFGLTSQKAI